MKKHKTIILLIVSICLLLAGVALVISATNKNTIKNCDDIVSEFMEKAKVNPLLELTGPVAKCMDEQ